MDDVSSEYDSPIQRLEAAKLPTPPGLKPRALDAEVVPDSELSTLGGTEGSVLITIRVLPLVIPSAPKRKLVSLPSVSESDSEPNSPPASDDETASISDLVPQAVEENAMPLAVRRTTSMVSRDHYET